MEETGMEDLMPDLVPAPVLLTTSPVCSLKLEHNRDFLEEVQQLKPACCVALARVVLSKDMFCTGLCVVLMLNGFVSFYRKARMVKNTTLAA